MTLPPVSESGECPRLAIVFFGTPPFAAACLERLLETGHELRAVVTRPDRPRGRGQRLQCCAVKQLARKRNIEVLSPSTPKDPAFIGRLEQLAPDLAVVVAYGRILPCQLLELPRLGCINAHASLLPTLRGAAPIERAIAEGHEETGVTIMQMNEELDAGDILAARRTIIDESTDAGQLRKRLARLAAELLVETIDAMARGQAVSRPQNAAKATYAPPIRKEEGLIRWAMPAQEIARLVRAFHPTPGAYTVDAGRRLKILAACPSNAECRELPGTVIKSSGESMLVACGEGLLLVETVQPAGGRSMTAAAYLRGRSGKGPPFRLGTGQ